VHSAHGRRNASCRGARRHIRCAAPTLVHRYIIAGVTPCCNGKPKHVPTGTPAHRDRPLRQPILPPRGKFNPSRCQGRLDPVQCGQILRPACVVVNRIISDLRAALSDSARPGVGRVAWSEHLASHRKSRNGVAPYAERHPSNPPCERNHHDRWRVNCAAEIDGTRMALPRFRQGAIAKAWTA